MKRFFISMGGYLIRLKYEALVGVGVASYVAAYNAAGQIPGITPRIQTAVGWLGVVGAVVSFFVHPLRSEKDDSETAAPATTTEKTEGESNA